MWMNGWSRMSVLLLVLLQAVVALLSSVEVHGNLGGGGGIHAIVSSSSFSHESSSSLVSRERKLLRQLRRDTSEERLTVRLVHRHHPSSPEVWKNLTHVEHLADRILADKKRQKENAHKLRAQITVHFPKLGANDPNADTFAFSSPVSSGATLGSGQYFIDFYLGTPAQKFSLIADTGSDTIWVQCAPCISCKGQSGPQFSPADSSSYHELDCTTEECFYVPPPANATCDPRDPGVCDYEVSYFDGSRTVGVFATETTTMNVSRGAGKTVKISHVAFGCGLDNDGPSFDGASGILGLGQGPLAFPSQIGAYFGNKFSYCLVDYLDAPSISSTLVFGDVVTKSKQDAQFTPFLLNRLAPSQYYVGVQCISVGGKRLPVPPTAWQIDAFGNGGTIIDSGTTLTIFVEPAYLLILAAVKSALSCYPEVSSPVQLDYCFDTSAASSEGLNLPALSITFDSGSVFNPPTANIFVAVAPNTYCLAVGGSPGPYGFNILGNLIQQNFEITYDRQNQKLGFAPAQCAS